MKPWAKLLIHKGCGRCGVHWPIWAMRTYQMNEWQPPEMLNKALISKGRQHSLAFVGQTAISEIGARRQIPRTKPPLLFHWNMTFSFHKMCVSFNLVSPTPICPLPRFCSSQKPFPPRATISSDLIRETGPGLSRTAGDTSEGTPDASGSSWWWLSHITRLELTPNPHPTATLRP